ncbi:MAG: hypothetical protein WAK17_23845 [Candidatus Nitrosopolaris sp.]
MPRFPDHSTDSNSNLGFNNNSNLGFNNNSKPAFTYNNNPSSGIQQLCGPAGCSNNPLAPIPPHPYVCSTEGCSHIWVPGIK